MKKRGAPDPSARRSNTGKVCNVAILGFGTVGSSVAKILCERTDLGLRLTHILNRNVERKKVSWLPASVQWTEKIEEVLASDASIVVEVLGGLKPTEDWIERALSSGKSVVTANKQLIARRGKALMAVARRNKQQLLYGASVAGGVPVISGLQAGLAGDKLFKIRGILNGTCNYILSRMENDMLPFADALREAQKLGFAESDSTEDIDGLDARAKLAILARVGLHCDVPAESIAAQSISRIEAIDFEYSNQLGCTIRQISWAELNPSTKVTSKKTGAAQPAQDGQQRPADVSLFASVGPALVELSSPLARVEGSQNLVVATGIYGGETVFGGHGAGGDPTAVAVVSDMLAIARSTQTNGGGADQPMIQEVAVSNDASSKHYLRFYVRDQPGIIATLATILSGFGVNIDAVLQEPGHPKTKLPFLITLQECKASLVEGALDQINALDFLVQPCLHLPIF
jgi:Homoserine dehydrogenase